MDQDDVVADALYSDIAEFAGRAGLRDDRWIPIWQEFVRGRMSQFKMRDKLQELAPGTPFIIEGKSYSPVPSTELTQVLVQAGLLQAKGLLLRAQPSVQDQGLRDEIQAFLELMA